jgi:DNA polymerase IV
LRSRHMFAHTVSIKLRFADFRTITRDITLAGAADRDSEIYQAAKDLFLSHCGKPPWRLVGVRLAGLRCGQQLSLFSHEAGGEKDKSITTVKDGLRNKYGHEMVFHASRLILKKEE